MSTGRRVSQSRKKRQQIINDVKVGGDILGKKVR
jgi:hypothetical protein